MSTVEQLPIGTLVKTISHTSRLARIIENYRNTVIHHKFPYRVEYVDSTTELMGFTEINTNVTDEDVQQWALAVMKR